MPKTDAQKRANRKYLDSAYDRVAIRVRRGTRDRWRVAADRLGLSFAGLISAAVEEYIKNVREADTLTGGGAGGTPPVSGVDSLIVE